VTNPNKQTWEKLVHDAEIEPDVTKLEDKIRTAEDALFFRALDLRVSDDGTRERALLRKAADTLLKLKIEKLGWPSS